ncbi:MFS transporter [Luteococcus japonicus]|uniref:MFS transporter n=1 Tax=Luteococcus japonicus TaxID=33984 RepID=A0A3N1ZV40_9ACTN|nr:MFS transporter [Luteococcus japonicus]ROR54721.1 MFS transporter [Luteococcus japonicus]
MTSARELLRAPLYGRWLAGRAVSWFGDTVMILALSIWVKSLTGSSSQAGVTLAFFMAPQLLAPLAGQLVDHIPRRVVLVAGNLLSAVTLVPLWWVHRPDQAWVIWAAAVGYGLSGVLLSSASMALQRSITPDEFLARAQGLQQTVGTSFQLLAPLVGAALFATHGGRGPTAVAITCFLAGAVLFASFPEPAEDDPSEQVGLWRQMTAGLEHIWRHKPLLDAMTAMLLVNCVAGLLEGAMYSVTDTFGRSAAWAGTIASAQGAGMVAGSLAASRVVERIGEIHSMTVGLSISAVLVLLAAATPTLWTYLAVVVAIGAFLPMVFVAAGTLQQRVTPNHLMGRVGTAMAPLFSLSSVGAMSVGAMLVDTVSFRQIHPLVTVGMAGSAVWLRLATRRRSHPGAPQPQDQSSRTTFAG